MPTLLLLRHGALPPDPDRRFVGQRDVPLSALGIAQARYWARELRGMPLREIWCSDLTRCADTAGIIAREAGFPVHADAAFREISLGAWEGRSRHEVQALFPGEYEARGRDFWNSVPSGGESFAMLAGRVLPALDRLTASLPQESAFLLVTHSGVARTIVMRHLALPARDLLSIPFPCGACARLETAPSGPAGALPSPLRPR